MLRDWRLGFAKSEWRSLKDYLKQKGFSEKEMLNAGLIKENEKKEIYDRFRGRIIFPIFDTASRVIAFSGRLLADKENEPKYLNSPDTELFDKSRNLYGYHIAKKAVREKGFAILVEGQMDLLLSHQAGFANTVASSGTALSVEHLSSLKRLTDTLVIAYDADKAGINATFRAWKLALHFDFELKIALLPRGLDPADAVAKDLDIWKQAVANAVGVIDYFLETMKGEQDEKARDTMLVDRVLPLIKSVGSSISASRFIQKASFATGIAENALWEALAKVKDEEIQREVASTVAKKESTSIRRVRGFLLWLLSINNAYSDEFALELKRIIADYDSEELQDKDALIFEIEMLYGNDANLKQVGSNILRHLEEEILKKDLVKAMERLKRAEAMHDLETLEKELQTCQTLSSALAKLPKQ